MILRRKLLLHFGAVVAMFVLTAAAVLWHLESVLRDVRHVDTEAWVVVERVNELSININEIESDLYSLQFGRRMHLDSLIEAVESARNLMGLLGENYVMQQQAEAKEKFTRIKETLPVFERHVGALATAQDRDLARQHTEMALSHAVAMRRDMLPLSQISRAHARAEQEALTTRFRNVVLSLAIAFLLVINVSVIVILRMGSIIVHPVDQLLQATRELAQENFDYRVSIDQKGEFQELAQAYNKLAEDLQASEGRKVETLTQAAVMINHELNNAMAVIQLQLQRLGRDKSITPETTQRLGEIEVSLQRMTRTVQSLKNVRRIVLTDYVPGLKMLDLEKSTAISDADRG